MWSTLHPLLHPVLDLVPSQEVPNPGPSLPPGLDRFNNQFVAWAKGILIVAAVLGMLACAGMMMVGHRRRREMAIEGVTSLPWVIAGLAVMACASGVVGAMI